MFIGNPISSIAASKEFLPWIWGDFGQGFVPGATAMLLRNASYFPDAPVTGAWLTLGL